MESIWNYTLAQSGKEQALKYLNELDNAFCKLADNSFLCRERTEFTPTIYIYRHQSHLIAYHMRNDKLVIIRILYKHMDIDAQLEA